MKYQTINTRKKDSKWFFFTLRILTLLLLTSCASATRTSTIWIHSKKSECTGMQKNRQCLSISRNQSLDSAKWELLYANIEGFQFEPGSFQKIKIKETHLDKNTVPTDGSSVVYSLKKTLEKKIDPRFALQAIWVTDRIFGQPISQKTPPPHMEIHPTKMQFHGTDSCNRTMGKIKSLTTSEITFGSVATTRIYCPKRMDIATNYKQAIHNTKRYIATALELTFFDEKGNETIHFKKKD